MNMKNVLKNFFFKDEYKKSKRFFQGFLLWLTHKEIFLEILFL